MTCPFILDKGDLDPPASAETFKVAVDGGWGLPSASTSPCLVIPCTLTLDACVWTLVLSGETDGEVGPTEGMRLDLRGREGVEKVTTALVACLGVDVKCSLVMLGKGGATAGSVSMAVVLCDRGRQSAVGRSGTIVWGEGGY